jgi:hypothetical protein
VEKVQSRLDHNPGAMGVRRQTAETKAEHVKGLSPDANSELLRKRTAAIIDAILTAAA